tara:strand:- start:13267 stop:16680 length:3414 start_codon:yes stop_codon:yes gene_type:complete
VAGSTYNQVLRLSVQGLEKLDKLEASARTVQKLLTDIKPIRSPFADARVGTEKVKKLAKEVNEYTANVAGADNTARTFTRTVNGQEQKVQIYSTTLGGLNAQLNSFRALSANAKVGTDRFSNALNAATKIQREFLNQRLKAAQVEAAVSEGFVDDFIALNKTVPKSINGLNTYQAELQDLLQTVEIGSQAYRKLGQEISRVDILLGRGAEGEGRIQGPKEPPGRRRPRGGGRALVGGAFPLLFGGGPGAVVGGVIGELFGDLGGVVGSAVGGAVDSFVAETARTARSLLTLEGTLDLVSQKSLAASLADQKRLDTLSELGLSIRAETAARQELEKVLGKAGVRELTEAGQAVDSLIRQASANFLRLSASLSTLIGPVGQLIELILKLPSFGGKSVDQDLKDLFDFRQRLNKQIQEGAVPESVNERLRQRSQEIRQGLPRNRLGRVDESEVRKQLAPLIKQIEREFPILLPVKLTEKQKLQQEIEDLQLELKGNELLLSGVNAMARLEKLANRRAQLDRQEAEARKSLEKSLEDIRISVERRVQDMRMQHLRSEIQLRAQQGANELRQLQLQNQIKQQSLKQNLVISGARPEVASDTLALNQAFSEYAQKSLELENKKKRIQEEAVFKTLKIQLRTARFVEDTQKRISNLQLETQQKIDRITVKRNEMDSAVGKAKFEAEKLAAEIRLDVIELEFKLLAEKLKQAGLETESVENLLSTFKEIRKEFNEAQKQVEETQSPALPSAADPVGALSSVDISGVTEAAEEQLRIEDLITQAKLDGLETEQQIANLKRFSTASDIRLDIQQNLNNLLRNQQDQLTSQSRVLELVKGGMSEQVAIAVQQIEKQREIALARLDNLELAVRNMEIDKENTEELEKQRKELERIAKLRGKLLEGFENAETNAKDLADPIKKYMTELDTYINDTRARIVDLARTVEGEIGSAMSTAITNVITGTGTVQEAMSTMFANIGKAFIDMATQMIAKALIMKALGILGGGGGTPIKGSTGVPGLEPNSYYGTGGRYGSFTPPKLATGGPTRPNGTYLVGEQGPELLSMGNQPGYVHRNTSEVMDRYRNGGNQGGTAANLSVNYNVTDINGMRFVTEDQFRAGMTKAAKDGAKMGEAGTFKTMKNSRSSRARVGL